MDNKLESQFLRRKNEMLSKLNLPLKIVNNLNTSSPRNRNKKDFYRNHLHISKKTTKNPNLTAKSNNQEKKKLSARKRLLIEDLSDRIRHKNKKLKVNQFKSENQKNLIKGKIGKLKRTDTPEFFQKTGEYHKEEQKSAPLYKKFQRNMTSEYLDKRKEKSEQKEMNLQMGNKPFAQSLNSNKCLKMFPINTEDKNQTMSKETRKDENQSKELSRNISSQNDSLFLPKVYEDLLLSDDKRLLKYEEHLTKSNNSQSKNNELIQSVTIDENLEYKFSSDSLQKSEDQEDFTHNSFKESFKTDDLFSRKKSLPFKHKNQKRQFKNSEQAENRKEFFSDLNQTGLESICKTLPIDQDSERLLLKTNESKNPTLKTEPSPRFNKRQKNLVIDVNGKELCLYMSSHEELCNKSSSLSRQFSYCDMKSSSTLKQIRSNKQLSNNRLSSRKLRLESNGSKTSSQNPKIKDFKTKRSVISLNNSKGSPIRQQVFEEYGAKQVWHQKKSQRELSKDKMKKKIENDSEKILTTSSMFENIERIKKKFMPIPKYLIYLYLVSSTY